MRFRDDTEAEHAAAQGLTIQDARARLDAMLAASRVTSPYGVLDKSPVSINADNKKPGITLQSLKKLIEQLEREHERDLNFPDTHQTNEFDPEPSVAAAKAMYGEAMAETRKTIAKLKAKPEYAGVDLEMVVRTRAKAKPGQSRVDVSIVQRVLSSVGASSTQQEIRDAVQLEHPGLRVRKTWTTPLPRWLLDKAKDIVACSGPPFSQIEIKGSVSMSALHSLAKAAVAGQCGVAREYTATVLVGPDNVFINGVGFKISSNKSGKHTYRVVSVNVDKLHTALATPSRSRARPPLQPKAAKGATG